MGRVQDDKHSLTLEFWTPDDYEIEVVHSQSCIVWWGCEFREEKGVQTLDGCPNYHHAHRRYDCPLGYLVENIGLGDALFNMDTQYEEESLEVLRRYMGLPVPIHCDFSYGQVSYGFDGYEYEEELIWTFHPYYTHTWRQDVHICSVCHSTKQYVYETNYECEVPDGQSE